MPLTVYVMTKKRARRGEGAPSSNSLILRGYPLTNEALRANATANFDMYGFYGISVFKAETTDEVLDLCATKLRRLAEVAVFRTEDLLANRLELWDTGASPHYDVVRGPAAQDLDELISRVLATARTEHKNPYYMDGEER